MDLEIGEKPRRKSSRTSKEEKEEESERSQTGSPVPEKKNLPERRRAKKQEYSPEVESSRKNINTPTIKVGKTLRKKRVTEESLPSTRSTTPVELGKRERKGQRERYSPTINTPKSDPSKRQLIRRKPSLPTSETFLLSTLKEAFYVDGEIPQVDYKIPERFLKQSKENSEEPPDYTNCSINPESFGEESEGDETSETHPAWETMFESEVAIKQEPIDDFPGPSNHVVEEERKPLTDPEKKKKKKNEVDMNPEGEEEETIAPPEENKRKRKARKEEEGEEEPTRPVKKLRRSRAASLTPEPEPSQNLPERRSRRSMEGFKEFMANVKNGGAEGEGGRKRGKKLKNENEGSEEMKEEVEKKEEEETPRQRRQKMKLRLSAHGAPPTVSPKETLSVSPAQSFKAPSASPSPAPTSTRKSGRFSTSSVKQQDINEGSTKEKFIVKPKPGSALEIMKKASMFKRQQRSPTPETPTTSGFNSKQISPEEKKKEEEDEEKMEDEQEKIVEIPDELLKSVEKKKKIEEKTPEPGSMKAMGLEEELEDEQEEIIEDNSNVMLKEDLEELIDEEEETPQSSSKRTPLTLKGSIKLAPRRKKTDPMPVVQSSIATPEPTQPARRSSRALKPKLSEDFIMESPVIIRKDVEMKSPLQKTPTKSPVVSPQKKSAEKKQTDEETAAEKTRKFVEEHKGSIKLSFKIGRNIETVVKDVVNEEEGSNTPVDEKVEELVEETENKQPVIPAPVVPKPDKKKKSKEPHWWNSYTPSPKPVLENYVRPDGTIEHLGVVINSVMDALLLKVCEDGIRRHSNNKAKEARKAEMSEMAKKRYHEKKRIAEERIAKGEPPILPKKTTAEMYAHQISTRERTKKGAIYKTNEYLLKPARWQREADVERERSEQEARDYLNRQFMLEAEEDLRQEKRELRGTRRGSKSIKHVTFKDFCDTKGPEVTQILKSPLNPAFFHREILREPESNLNTVQVDEEINVVDEQALSNEFSSHFLEQARSAADQICTYLVRNVNQYGGCDIYDLVERVREEPELRQAIIANTIEVLIEFQQVQLGAEYSMTAHITMHNEAIRRAYDLKEAFSINNAEKETMAWSHAFLVENLPVDYLSGYLILLRYWKHQTGSSVASFAKKSFQEETYPWPEITEIIWQYIASKVVDPDRENLQTTINAEALSDVIFVLVPPSLTYGDYTYTIKAHETIYRWLKMIGSNESFILKTDFECSSYDSQRDMIDFFTRVVKNEVQKLVRETRDKRVVLVGWGLTSYLNHRVVGLIHGVSAIIDLAFPLKSKYGYRGTADDDILLTYCPVLFILGSKSYGFNSVALRDLKSGMLSESGSVVIHHADSNLYVPTYILNRYGFTQRSVYRAVVEYIVDFLKLNCTKKERSQLIQSELNSVYNLEVESLKTIVGGVAPLPPLSRTIKFPSVDSKPPRQRKKKTEILIPQPPALVPESAPATAAAEARYRFDEIVRNARISTSADLMSPTVPRTAPAMYKASPLTSPRVSLRPAFPSFTQPTPNQIINQNIHQKNPQQPLDPANISLS